MSKAKLQQLETTQNECLRAIAGAYKSTPIAVLEHETGCPPLPIHLEEQVIAYTERTRQGPARQHIEEACNNTRVTINRRFPPRKHPTPHTTRRDKLHQLVAATTGADQRRGEQTEQVYKKQRRGLVHKAYEM